MEDVSFFIDLLQNQPPYKQISITSQNYVDLSSCQSIRIEDYCVTCQKLRTFIQNHLDNTFISLRQELMKNTPSLVRVPISDVSINSEGNNQSYKSCFVGVVLYCAHCDEPHYYSVKIDENSICKIGQYPSFSRAETASLKKYKNLIKKYYVELTSAINAYSQNMGIAAFVYLRRILEHLIDTKYFALPSANAQTKFIDKLKAVELTETVIPESLSEVKEQIYSVLSKGVHEYTEVECINLFEIVLYVITAILDQELYKKQQILKAAAAKKIIDEKLKENK